MAAGVDSPVPNELLLSAADEEAALTEVELLVELFVDLVTLI